MTSQHPIDLKKLCASLTEEVKKQSGVNVHACYQCQICTNACPFSEAMDIKPAGIVRLAQLGLVSEALASSTIWLCIGCNTCCNSCPMAIDMPAIMDALRQQAIDSGKPIAEQDILDFHREILGSIERYGRTHKLEIMLRYKIKRRDWFSDMNLGLRMFAKRKLDLTPSKIENIGEVKSLFDDGKEGKK